MKKINILITGGLGHIGSLLLRKIIKIKNLDHLYIIDNARSNNLNVLFNINKNKKKIHFFQSDLLEETSLKKITKSIDVVIHLASITNAEQSFKIKKLLFKNNFGIFKNVVKFCIKKKSKLIHLSSTSIYGTSSKVVNEDTKDLKPQSPYAHEKLLEENFLKKNKNKLNYITLRLGTITGISKGMRFHTAVNKFCLNTILKVDIPIWNNAMDQHRPYLSLDDAIRSIIFIIKKNLFDKEIYNILTGNYTVRQILKIIQKQKYRIKIKKVKSPILNQNSYHVSGKKFEKFGLKFNKNIENDIKNTLDILKALY